MQDIAELVKGLKKSPVRRLVDARLRSFRALGGKGNNELFKELCFCLLTANFNAGRGMEIQCKIDEGFLTLPKNKLAKELKGCGHRFPNARAAYIVEARKFSGSLKEKLSAFKNEKEAREWLVKNVKGLGMKEASHFLRNIGYENLAIIDFHIIDLLARHGLLEGGKTEKGSGRVALTKKNYLAIERVLAEIARRTGTSLAELDLYLWYEETGKVLK